MCRLVEGDIFRLGMHIEDIKEMIDLNVCEQISPPHSSSTPTALKEALHENPSPVCMRTPSPASALHEVTMRPYQIKTASLTHREKYFTEELCPG